MTKKEKKRLEEALDTLIDFEPQIKKTSERCERGSLGDVCEALRDLVDGSTGT